MFYSGTGITTRETAQPYLLNMKRCLCAGAHLWGDDHGEADGREKGEVGAVHRHVVQPEQHRPVGVGQTTPRLYVSVLQPIHKLSVILRRKKHRSMLTRKQRK